MPCSLPRSLRLSPISSSIPSPPRSPLSFPLPLLSLSLPFAPSPFPSLYFPLLPLSFHPLPPHSHPHSYSYSYSHYHSHSHSHSPALSQDSMLNSKTAIFKLRKELRSAIKTLTVAEEAMVEVDSVVAGHDLGDATEEEHARARHACRLGLFVTILSSCCYHCNYRCFLQPCILQQIHPRARKSAVATALDCCCSCCGGAAAASAAAAAIVFTAATITTNYYYPLLLSLRTTADYYYFTTLASEQP